MSCAVIEAAGAEELSPMGKAALAYANAGRRVFPVGRNKKPFIKGWPDVASRDPEQVVEWWTEWPEANVCALTGTAGNCIVVDIDPRNGGDEDLAHLQEEHGQLPDTLTCLTGGGGRHLYYQLPDFEVRKCNLAPGVEVLGERNAATLPPSMHASGQRYRWADGPKVMAKAPEWLLDLVRPKPIPPVEPISFEDHDRLSNYVRAALEREIHDARSASGGARNAQLNKSAYALGQIVGAGALDESLARQELEEAGRHSGLPGREVRATVRSGLTAGKRNPRRFDFDGGA